VLAVEDTVEQAAAAVELPAAAVVLMAAATLLAMVVAVDCIFNAGQWGNSCCCRALVLSLSLFLLP